MSTLEANSLTMTQATIYPFTTLLVPLHDKPSISQAAFTPQTPSSPPSSSFSTDNKSSNKTWVFIVVGAMAIVSVLFGIVLFIYFRKSKKKKESVIVSKSFEAGEKQGKKIEGNSDKQSEIIASIAQSCKVYSFEELKRATDNFSQSCWIKGSAYRGVIKGDVCAIKMTEGDVSKEIEVLNKANHCNVIRLSGVCFNEGHWYLVYEYAANGALSDWIYLNNTDSDGKFLSWSQRIQIALDVATGLDYLHSFTSPPHIHKDLKCSNILLDSDLRAKVANLSLARSLEGGDGQFPLTRHIVGTRGYMAPEYLENGLVTTKLDVYAFGVLLLEILTGKEVAAILIQDKTLSDVLSPILDKESGHEKVKEFLDPSLLGHYPLELAMYVVKMIDNCIEKDPASRPEMHEIVQSLSRTLYSSLTWETSVNSASSQSFSKSF